MTSAKKGTLRVNMNKDFKLKKIEVGERIFKETPGTATSTYTKKIEDADVFSELDQYDTYSIKWKKVKNGKKIKLSKVDDEIAQEYKKNTDYTLNNTYTATYVRVTVYDKKNKTTKRYATAIYRTKK